MVVTKNLNVGSHIITFSASGYDTLSAEILVSEAGVTCVKVEGDGSCGSTTPPGINMTGVWSVFGTLKLVPVTPPPKGYIAVTSSPANASVDVNGTDIGKTPVTGYELTTGSKLVTIRLSGYIPEERSVTIVHGETASLSVSLTPLSVEEEGFIFVTSAPSGANVSIGGVSIGSTPIDNYGLLAGLKTVAISLTGYETATRDVTIVAGESATVDVTLVESLIPTDICGWIDEVGIETLTRDHTLYVFYLSLGATGFAEVKYQGLIPKPSPILGALAIRDNVLGIYYYSRGSITMANIKTGCSF